MLSSGSPERRGRKAEKGKGGRELWRLSWLPGTDPLLREVDKAGFSWGADTATESIPGRAREGRDCIQCHGAKPALWQIKTN